jgi:hypothetical protein
MRLFWLLTASPVFVAAIYFRRDHRRLVRLLLTATGVLASLLQLAILAAVILLGTYRLLPPWSARFFFIAGALWLITAAVLLLINHRRSSKAPQYFSSAGMAILAFAVFCVVAKPLDYYWSVTFLLPTRIGALNLFDMDPASYSAFFNYRIDGDRHVPEIPHEPGAGWKTIEAHGWRIQIPESAQVGRKFQRGVSYRLGDLRIILICDLPFAWPIEFPFVGGSAFSRLAVDYAKRDWNFSSEYDFALQAYNTTFDDVRKATDFPSLLRAETLYFSRFSSSVHGSPLLHYEAPSIKGFIGQHEKWVRASLFSRSGKAIFTITLESETLEHGEMMKCLVHILGSARPISDNCTTANSVGLDRGGSTPHRRELAALNMSFLACQSQEDQAKYGKEPGAPVPDSDIDLEKGMSQQEGPDVSL